MNKKRIWVWFIAMGLVLIGVVVLTILIIRNTEIQRADNKGYSGLTVKRVIDGDTFELYNGGIVRLICVDTPEKGKKGYEEAKEFLESLILYKEVVLEKDISEIDNYGRLLRYVYLNDSGRVVFVNKEIVQQRYGGAFAYGNDTSKCKEIELS
ncbi:MAG: thermonuclease family protein [Nanoarchaeota archaeon]|nr:thermonuclease family protein [Nanoarchaeota archaeon]